MIGRSEGQIAYSHEMPIQPLDNSLQTKRLARHGPGENLKRGLEFLESDGAIAIGVEDGYEPAQVAV